MAMITNTIPSGSSFLWHDYETFGIDPRLDRTSQFACIRTDADLNEIGEPLILYCKPANDFLPSPEACLITGITPQEADEKGICESDFFKRIYREMMVPETCSVGFNSLNFDDEVTRHGFYRNFHDAYEREHSNGNSRWDMINVARMVHALRPDKFTWPIDAEGKLSFKLENLTKANGIAHEGAHDALSDVRATIDLARLIKSREPRFYDFMLKNKGKIAASSLLVMGEPVLHCSSTYSIARNYLSLVLPVARHPTNMNAIIAYDLTTDPAPLLSMSAEDIKKWLYVKQVDLPEGMARIPLITIQINKCPVLAPRSAMRECDANRLAFDNVACDQHAELLLPELAAIEKKVKLVFKSDYLPESDPDVMLYSGGFLSYDDKRKVSIVRNSSPEALAVGDINFTDPRLPEMLFRYRARNFHESLSPAELISWNTYRLARIEQLTPGYIVDLDARLDDDQYSDRDLVVLTALKAHALSIISGNDALSDDLVSEPGAISL